MTHDYDRRDKTAALDLKAANALRRIAQDLKLLAAHVARENSELNKLDFVNPDEQVIQNHLHYAYRAISEMQSLLNEVENHVNDAAQ